MRQSLWNLGRGLITDKLFLVPLSIDNLVTYLNYANYTTHGKITMVNYLPIIDESRKHNMPLARFSCFCEYSCHILTKNESTFTINAVCTNHKYWTCRKLYESTREFDTFPSYLKEHHKKLIFSLTSYVSFKVEIYTISFREISANSGKESSLLFTNFTNQLWS